MKLRRVLLLSILGMSGLPLAAPAQDVAPRDPPKMPEAGSRDNALPTKIVAFLGTATKESTAQQREAAHLPDGVGLTVQHVLAGSPADEADIRPLDLLHRLNDQILINDPQFRVLLRTFRPGDQIRLTLIREGRPREAKVVLGQRRVPFAPTPARELLRWMLMPPDPQTGFNPIEFTARYEDDQHVLVLARGRHGKYLEVRDKRGKLVFEGPVDTAAQRRLVPEAVRPKLKTLEAPPKSPEVAPKQEPKREEESLP